MSNWAFYYGCFSITVNEQKTIIWIYICINVYTRDISDREKNIIEINDNFGKMAFYAIFVLPVFTMIFSFSCSASLVQEFTVTHIKLLVGLSD